MFLSKCNKLVGLGHTEKWLNGCLKQERSHTIGIIWEGVGKQQGSHASRTKECANITCLGGKYPSMTPSTLTWNPHSEETL